MKTIKKEDLIKNEIYVHKNGNIVKYKYLSDFGKVCGEYVGESKNIFNNNGGNFVIKELQLATPQEKHWLNSCITADKFISYEEAMKTFIPEYVECIQPEYWRRTIQENNGNLIFKSDFKSSCTNQIKNVCNFNSFHFKPSTKEAYNAQFVVKEPEFVLPEIWHVIVTKENQKVLSEWRGFESDCLLKVNKLVGLTKKNDGSISKGHNPKNSIKCKNPHSVRRFDFGNEITFEQFKQYVLKEPVTKEIVEPLPQFKVIETIETITKVENNEGNQFFIGDVVTVDGSNITETIKSFEYQLNKTVLVAVFTNNSFIDINSIEHYIEPKIEFVLPKKWCIKSKNRKHDKILNSYARSIGATWWNDISNYISKLYMLVDNSQYFNSSEHKPTAYTEITFEQFEKYVLNKTVEVKEETLLEKAKRLYPAGTKFIPTMRTSASYEISSGKFKMTDFKNFVVDVDNELSIYSKSLNKWAEIVK